MSTRPMEGKRVLITGAATGIGKATALELAGLGCHIGINFFSSDKKAKDLASKICAELELKNCKTLLLQADVSDEVAVKAMFEQILESWGGLDVLINNAGIQKKCSSHEVSLDSFQQVFNTNALGTFLCSREALKVFLKQKSRGSIINNTSVHEVIPKPEYLSYSMSKGAIENLTKTLALEYADRGIRINSIAPGAIITPINPWTDDEEKMQSVRSHIPMGKIGTAEQVADVMSFLVSDKSSYITGQTIFVDGGLTLYPDFGEDWSSS